MAEADGTAYTWRAENDCTATLSEAGASLSDRLEPAGFLNGVIGADEAGSETVNDVAANHYTSMGAHSGNSTSPDQPADCGSQRKVSRDRAPAARRPLRGDVDRAAQLPGERRPAGPRRAGPRRRDNLDIARALLRRGGRAGLRPGRWRRRATSWPGRSPSARNSTTRSPRTSRPSAGMLAELLQLTEAAGDRLQGAGRGARRAAGAGAHRSPGARGAAARGSPTCSTGSRGGAAARRRCSGGTPPRRWRRWPRTCARPASGWPRPSRRWTGAAGRRRRPEPAASVGRLRGAEDAVGAEHHAARRHGPPGRATWTAAEPRRPRCGPRPRRTSRRRGR